MKSSRRNLLPGLIIDAIAALQVSGVEPDIWKIQGIDERADCEHAAAQARIAGRDNVVCIVLGHSADADQVQRWLKEAAGVVGYAGFAAGRTIWREPLADHVARGTDPEAARERIVKNCLDMIDTYEAAATEASATPALAQQANHDDQAATTDGEGNRF